MICVDVSGDGRALLAVGLDCHSKQQITLWDISDVKTTRRASVLLKSTTEYNIKRAKFSPYEPDKFMTAGRDSIRLYRIKNGTLRGLSIQVCTITMPAVHLAVCNQHGLRFYPSGESDLPGG
jgi:WD repeat-containing protein 90